MTDERYTREHFSRESIEISPNLRDHALRADQFAAVCYAHGIGLDEVRPMLREPQRTAAGDLVVPATQPEDEAGWTRPNVALAEQLEFIAQHALRRPTRVLSVGSGRGETELVLARLGVSVLAIEPAEAANLLLWENWMYFCVASDMVRLHQLPATLGEALANPTFRATWPGIDAVLFVESIEHIPIDETMALAALLRATDRPRRLIVTNWTARHPIVPDMTGWNHITHIDDAFYDNLARGGRQVLRHGSHLVLDFPAKETRP